MQAAGAVRPAWSEVPGPSRWTSGARARRSAARRPIAAPKSPSIVRAKIGFCNCTTGVSDDEELDRIGDFDLLGNKLAALGPGRPIAVAWMKGRSRAFTISGERAGRPSRHSRSASTTTAMPIVATAVLGHEQPAAIEPAVLEFLNSKTVLHWAEVTLGL